MLSVTQSRLTLCNPRGPQHARLPCPSPSPEVCPKSCPLHRWCHPAISSSDALFSFFPQSYPVSGTFPRSQLFTSDDWNTGVSASAPVLPKSIQNWFPLRLTGLICLLSKGLSGVFSSTAIWNDINSSMLRLRHGPALTWPLGKPIALTLQTFVGRVMSPFSNTLSRFVIAFLPRNKHLLISWLQSPSAVILEPQKRKSVTASTFSPSICHEVMRPDVMILFFCI